MAVPYAAADFVVGSVRSHAILGKVARGVRECALRCPAVAVTLTSARYAVPQWQILSRVRVTRSRSGSYSQLLADRSRLIPLPLQCRSR